MYNPLLGDRVIPSQGVQATGEPVAASDPVRGLDAIGSDGTERVVGLFILAALGVLIFFRYAGFNAVIAAKVGVGG